MRKRFKISKKKSKRIFRKTAKPILINKKRKGLKRGGIRL